eukprot:TRINITY_DN18577_c0_g1_i2.p1 TRINITY_DN18577_c0_g1~~TRINITY_DN18577_c0_g1_i2.p1  ORF type:complete len:301 (-),score=41.70 TRINITY_DN18577_c0_g1_i2:40-942(-)
MCIRDRLCTGAAIGDAAVVVLDREHRRARQLNAVTRLNNSASDTGGQLNMSMEVSGEVVGFSEKMPADDLVVLCTDGLTDNVHPGGAFSTLIPFVAGCATFDTKVDPDCGDHSGHDDFYVEWQLPTSVAHVCLLLYGTHDVHEAILTGRLPSLNRGEHGSRECSVPERWLDYTSTEEAVTRLVNYVDWVTRLRATREEAYYRLLLRSRTMGAQTSGEATEEGESTAAEIEDSLRAMMDARPAHSDTSCKTDDCAVLVLQPLHSGGVRTRLPSSSVWKEGIDSMQARVEGWMAGPSGSPPG